MDVEAVANGLTDAEKRSVPGYEGLYEVDRDGRIYSLPRTFVRRRQGWADSLVKVPGREKKLGRSRKGYWQVSLSANGIPETREVHRIVCRVFHGEPRDENLEVAHINGDKTDNRAVNLRWATRSENMQDKWAHGTMPAGNLVRAAKLDPPRAREICALALAEGANAHAIGRRFGVTEAAVRKIRDGKLWAQETLAVRDYLERQ